MLQNVLDVAVVRARGSRPRPRREVLMSKIGEVDVMIDVLEVVVVRARETRRRPRRET